MDFSTYGCGPAPDFDRLPLSTTLNNVFCLARVSRLRGVTDAPRLPHIIATERLDLISFSAEELWSLSRAEATVPELRFFSNPEHILGGDDAWIATIFGDRLIAEPRHEGWTLRGIIHREEAIIIGHAGFHLAPDEEGMVEVGYTILPTWRGHRYATEALRGLIDAARKTNAVRTIQACIAPDNAASLAVVGHLGFTFSAAVIDEVDGIEHCYTLEVSP